MTVALTESVPLFFIDVADRFSRKSLATTEVPGLVHKVQVPALPPPPPQATSIKAVAAAINPRIETIEKNLRNTAMPTDDARFQRTVVLSLTILGVIKMSNSVLSAKRVVVLNK
jgi:hypothetical protein